jgi:hypothetical protein
MIAFEWNHRGMEVKTDVSSQFDPLVIVKRSLADINHSKSILPFVIRSVSKSVQPTHPNLSANHWMIMAQHSRTVKRRLTGDFHGSGKSRVEVFGIVEKSTLSDVLGLAQPSTQGANLAGTEKMRTTDSEFRIGLDRSFFPKPVSVEPSHSALINQSFSI